MGHPQGPWQVGDRFRDKRASQGWEPGRLTWFGHYSRLTGSIRCAVPGVSYLKALTLSETHRSGAREGPGHQHLASGPRGSKPDCTD